MMMKHDKSANKYESRTCDLGVEQPSGSNDPSQIESKKRTFLQLV